MSEETKKIIKAFKRGLKLIIKLLDRLEKGEDI